MPEDEKFPTTPDEPALDEYRSDNDDDVEGHSFRSRTRPHEQGGSAPGVTGALDPDIDVRS